MNGKGSIVAAAISTMIGILMTWLALTQLVIDPIRDRQRVARENLVREVARIDHTLSELDQRIRHLEQARRVAR
jgi:hypothetical protein